MSLRRRLLRGVVVDMRVRVPILGWIAILLCIVMFTHGLTT
jgi:hypothetical protein